MGVYDKILPTLPPKPVDDVKWQAKVDKRAQEIKEPTLERLSPTASELTALYHQARQRRDDINVLLSRTTIEIAALEKLLIESYEADEEGWGLYGAKDNMLRMPDGSGVRVQGEVYAAVEDKEAYRQWCIANGYERQMQLWPSKTTEIVRERAKEGEPPPDGCKAYSHLKIALMSAKDDA